MTSHKNFFGRASLPRRYCYDERRERNSTTVAKFSSKQYPFSLAKTPSVLCEMISRTRRGLLTCKVRLSEISWVAHKIARSSDRISRTVDCRRRPQDNCCMARKTFVGRPTEICWAPNILSRIIDTRVEIAVTRSNLINNSPAAYIIRIPHPTHSSSHH